MEKDDEETTRSRRRSRSTRRSRRRKEGEEKGDEEQEQEQEQEQQQEELTCRVRKESYRGRGKTIALRDCSARNVPGTCVIFFVGSGPRATRPL